MQLQFFGATGEVTGSLQVVRAGGHTVLLECGLIQGSASNEKRNRDSFPVAIDDIDAVVLSHAHIDHSGRIPLLVRRGYTGPVYAQNATGALCKIMLPDSGYLNEKDAEWENKRRAKNGKNLVEPLYTRRDAEDCLAQFETISYGENVDIAPDLSLRFHDAGHILGSSIVELAHNEKGKRRTLVFSGDLGYRDAPVMNSPVQIKNADAVLMESTYGDRLHRPFAETIEELTEIFAVARQARGNILIPAFTVGRTQDLLYLMSEYQEQWGLDNWQVYLDSPMGVAATETYAHYRHLYGAKLFRRGDNQPELPHFHASVSTEDSMAINHIKSGAVIIAGSGMCSGGRIHHHLKNNIWRPECHLVIVGFQAFGTLGRRLVDGADEIKLWGERYPVRAKLHTVGGLSAHADQLDLTNWYGEFANRPPVYLVHGEPKSQQALAAKLVAEHDAKVVIAERELTISI